jgi:NAD(P)-dependent dehydrogenase (short-subunit alcohol dehydrogenase family)
MVKTVKRDHMSRFGSRKLQAGTGRNGAKPTVVITGGSRGIGNGLARCFLDRGASVVISGRMKKSVDDAVAGLGAASCQERVGGTVCDVRRYEDVQGLWDYAMNRFGRIDIWINNAGLGQPQTDLDGLDPCLIDDLFGTNCTGALYGCKVALTGMKVAGSGAIYNMEGLGSKGGLIRGMTAYGASKRALAYITDSLAMEAKGSGVIVGAIQPGMTATELITREYEGKPEQWAKVKRIFNILSDTVETISPWLVDRMLSNTRNGARIVWLTGQKAAWRFMTSPFIKRTIYPDQIQES